MRNNPFKLAKVLLDEYLELNITYGLKEIILNYSCVKLSIS
ncbi:hypothetical protein PEPS_44250 (plasmid) [Persicobacter psychrovividus]|uniref:Uncharacterized protein n=1 Tax=Persicobacter psychrovividus TaxID=387638 RepID=A0ABM7VMA4_9BACT|nr:hypothetical protein PEPS_44250 [Persicobacter psychrovividus]